MAEAKPFVIDLKLGYLLKHHKNFFIGCLLLFVIAFLASILLVIDAPDDYLQGVYAKIMYIHVPSAWVALMLYILLTAFSLLFMIMKNPIFFYASYSLAPIGLTFSIITLITGSIWGKPTWGTWWVWDARLTSMLILAFIYLAYISIASSFRNEMKAASISSIFAIVGLINIPIIKFSVHLWSTLHQGSSLIKYGGPSIHSSMLAPLLICFFSVVFFCCGIFILRIKFCLSKRKINKLQSVTRK